MRYLNLTISCPDVDYIEHQLRASIESSFNVVSIKTLPKTEHLKENKKYKELLRQKKIANDNLYKFIDINRENHP